MDLDKCLLNRLMDFVTDAEDSAQLKFKPGELSAPERAAVHEFACARGLESRSEGPLHSRRLILSVPKYYSKAMGEANGGAAGGRVVSCAADLDKDDEVGGWTRPSKASSKKAEKSRLVGSTSGIVLEQAVFGMLDLLDKPSPDCAKDASGHNLKVGEMDVAGQMFSLNELEEEAGPIIAWDPVRAPPPPGSPEAVFRAVLGEKKEKEDGNAEGNSVWNQHQKIVVILWGVPGSGKSVLAKRLACCLGAEGKEADHSGGTQHHHAVICSADAYFDSCAGQQRHKLKGNHADDDAEVKDSKAAGALKTYHRNYDGAKIGEAHNYCRALYASALANDSIRGIVVDNTNTRMSEYAWYIKEAEKLGETEGHASVCVIVAELFCKSCDMMRLLHARNQHRVPLQAVARLYARMEADPRAVLISPASSVGVLGEPERFSPPSRHHREEKLADWLAAHHCFRNVPSRPRTHLQLQHVLKVEGDKTSLGCGRGRRGLPASTTKFVYVPPSLYGEFLERYAEETIGTPSISIVGEGTTTTWWLAEYATEPCFRLFIDIDILATACAAQVQDDQQGTGQDELVISEMEVASLLQRSVAEGDEFAQFIGEQGKESEEAIFFPRVVVVGRPSADLLADGQTKQCFHLHCPDAVVDLDGMRQIRQRLVLALATRWPHIDWGVAVDDEVYTHMTLRMLGSSKPKSATGKSATGGGRPYELLGALSSTGEDDFEATARYNLDPVQLLCDTSIRCLPGEMTSFAKRHRGR